MSGPASFAIYCTADRNAFFGLVGLVGSLRHVGHHEAVVVKDAGLEPWQREALSPHVRFEQGDGGGSNPYFSKYAIADDPVDVVVLVDADVIVTRPLDDLVARAAAGRIVAFADPLVDRFRTEWSAALGLPAGRPHPYVNAGLAILPSLLRAQLLGAVASKAEAVPYDVSLHRGSVTGHPFLFYDQDVLNAVLAQPGLVERLDVLDGELAPHPPFRDTRLPRGAGPSAARLADGRQPYLLHHTQRKPWSGAAVRPNVYLHLLSWLLRSPEAAVQVPRERVPLRLRPGLLGVLERARLHATGSVAEQRGRLGIRRRLTRRSAERAGKREARSAARHRS